MARSWKQFMTKMEKDAKAAGPQHAVTLEALKGHFHRAGLELAKRRQELGLTQEQVEEASGVDQAEISRIERGLADPRESTLVKIGQALRMGLLTFAGSSGQPRVKRGRQTATRSMRFRKVPGRKLRAARTTSRRA